MKNRYSMKKGGIIVERTKKVFRKRLILTIALKLFYGSI